MAALMASSASTEQWIFTGGSERSRTMSVFLIERASSTVLPLTHSVASCSSSVATEWGKGKEGGGPLSLNNPDIVPALSLPPVKIHCSVLAEDAIKAAIGDWKKKHGVEVPVAEKVAH